MSANKAYGIGEVSDVAGISTRTLRYYEEEGLLVPARTANGYRRYTPADLDRLQEILLLRHMGMSVAEIPSALSATEDERRRTLARHLETLRAERERLDALIRTVENTIEHIEKGVPMDDKAKFEGMKRDLVEQNERTHGAEVRERWGDTAADEANRKMLNLSESEFERFQELGCAINESLEAAVSANADPAGDEGSASIAFIASGSDSPGTSIHPRRTGVSRRCTSQMSVSLPITMATSPAAPLGCGMR